MDITKQISRELAIQPGQIESVMALLNEGATVPFISRYRKERTGNLDEIQVRDISHRYAYFTELDERRETILDSVRSQGKLTPELASAILATVSKTELEDLYLPFKPKRVTRASMARDAGLEPLARRLQNLEDPRADLAAEAAGFINPEKGFDTPEKTLHGAGDILAEEITDDAEARKTLRRLAVKEGFLTAIVRKEFDGQKTKFEMYHDYRERAATLPAHRLLAMLRGEREKVLRLELEFPREKAAAYLEARFVRNPKSAAAPLLREMVKDGLDRLLAPATETEVRKELRARAEAEAFKVFGDNLRDLLLAPPAGQLAVLGIDPGFRTGCKVAAIDRTGRFLEYRAIFPHEPENRTREAAETLRDMIAVNRIELIAIGNGTAGRETESFVRDVLASFPAGKRPLCVMVNESGASVYSAFGSREELKSVPGLGAKTFEQAAGFLRIPGARNPLDDSAVHPERYGFVENLAASLGATVELMIGNSRLLGSLDKEHFVSDEAGLPTIEDILRELEKPGRDPRSAFKAPSFSETVREITDLVPGMRLEGVVTNVTNFGAFVDIGVHQDGLVHVSELADRYVSDPRKVVRVGQVVTVRVLKADPELKRIALSLKEKN